MNELKIEKNMAIELIRAMDRYVFNSEIIKQCADSGYQIDEQLAAWVKQVDTETSPFFKNDLILMRGLERIQSVLLDLVLEKRITTAVELLDEFRRMKVLDFLQLYFKTFFYEWDGSSPIAYEELEEKLRERVEADQIALILETIRYPEELKERAYQTFKSFYERFVAPYEAKVSRYLDEKINAHQKLYVENPELFIRMIFFMNYDEWVKLKQFDYLIIASYYAELNVEMKIYNNKRILIYGITIEQRYKREILAERQKQFFKVLSDEKRVEILKLLAQRAWYGNELAKHFGLTTATMSYHLSKLMDLELITPLEGEQNRFYYRLEKERVKELFLGVLKEIVGEKDESE